MNIGPRVHVSSDSMVFDTLGAVEVETYSREINGKTYEFTESVVTSPQGFTVTQYGAWLEGAGEPSHCL